MIEVFMAKYAEWERQRGKNLPRVLKIDEIYFGGKVNTLFVDGDTDDAIELLPSRRNCDIRKRLMEANNRGAVNRFARMMEAVSRGLSPEVRRARLLWADAHRRTERWPECLGEIKGKMTPQRLVELADAWLAGKEAAEQEAASTAAPMPTIEAPVLQPEVQHGAEETSNADTGPGSPADASPEPRPDKKPVRRSDGEGDSAGQQGS